MGFHQATPPRLPCRSGRVSSSSPRSQHTRLVHGGHAGPVGIAGLFERQGRGQGALRIWKRDMKNWNLPSLPWPELGPQHLHIRSSSEPASPTAGVRGIWPLLKHF